jgi:hypothetical protein
VSVYAQPRTPTVELMIVWGTGTDADTSEYDDVSSYYLSDPGITVSGLGRDQIRAYAPPDVTALDCVLNNEDGRFSPGGPLAGFVGRGPSVTATLRWGQDVPVDDTATDADDTVILTNGQINTSIFTGNANDMPQSIDRDSRTVQVRALGKMSKLQNKDITTQLYESIRTDEAITVILDAVGWDATARSLDTGDTTLLYWWLNGENALQALVTLLATEGAGSCAYEDGEGVFHFEGRVFRESNPRSLNTQYVITDGQRGLEAGANDQEVLADDPNIFANGALDPLFHVIPAQYRSNPDEVVSEAFAQINTRTLQAVGKIWEFGTSLTLSSGETRDIYVTASDPFKNAVTPLSGTDYTVTAGSLTSVSLLTTSGETIVLRLVAGGAGATVIGVTSNGIQVRAASLPVTATQRVVSNVDTSLTETRSNPQQRALSMWPEVEYNATQDIVDALVRRYQRERPQMVIQMQNMDAIHMQAMLSLRVSDKIQISHRHAGIADPYWIETLQYIVAPGNGFVTLVLGCERVYDLVGSRYGFAVYDSGIYGT